MNNRQFRVLLREFLFRMVDLELLAPKSDMSKLLGQFAALLIFVSLVFVIPAVGLGDAKNLPPQMALMLAWSGEHFLIATTMLVAGLFAVLSWDSTFPNKRDVFVLGPLPVRARTMFLAKVTAVSIALILAVTALHALAGLAWPAALFAQSKAQPTPILTYERALRPADTAHFGAQLDRDLAPALRHGGALAPETGAGVTIGVVKHGARRIFAYGTAKPDSIFEIGSLSKTFTGLLLAQLVVQGHARLNEPVRGLLPGVAPVPAGFEIRLLDLATHRSGLPSMPDNIHPADSANPLADYRETDLFAYLAKHGVAMPDKPAFEYSNFGYSVLGDALAHRAGMAYADLLQQEIAGPLGLRDTVVALSQEQQSRLIPGYGIRHLPVHAWDMDAMVPAGGIRSTAGDMLTYLDAQLHPDSSSLRAAVKQSHLLQADVADGLQIALAWLYMPASGTYWHNGATGGYSSYALFNPKGDFAAVVLLNQTPGVVGFVNLLGEHIRERLAGEPALSLDNVAIPASGGFAGLIRMFAVYWSTMLLAGAFIFCFVLGLQGLAAELLPRRWFLRASSVLQMIAFGVFVSVYLLEPMQASPDTIVAAQNHGLLYWSPSYWFLGLFQQLNGSSALAPLAHRAWIGFAVTFSLTAIAYLLSYSRTLRKIIEEPDIVASSRGLHWLPRFGNGLETAVTQFSIRTLLRSRQHRVILAFYWGVALAFVVLGVKAPEMQQQLVSGRAWHEPSTALLITSMVVLCAAILGVRVVIPMPLELRANWIFQIAPVAGGARSFAAIRRALYVVGLAPVWLACGAFFVSMWPWRAALGHLAVLGLVGIALTEFCLAGVRNIPFTCSYLPGKSGKNTAVAAFFVCMSGMVAGAEKERQALGDFGAFVAMIALLSAVAAAAWWRTSRLARSPDSTLLFEETPEPAIFALDLHRDGTPPS